MDKNDIKKIGFLNSSDENWKLLQEILTDLCDQVFPDKLDKVEKVEKKGKK